MKNQKGFIQIPLLIAIITGALVLGGSGYFGVKQYQNYQVERIEQKKIAREKEQEAQAATEVQQKALEQAQIEIEKLRQENVETKEKQKTLEQEVKTKAEQPKTENQKTDLASLIDQWGKSVVKITCAWIDSSTGKVFRASQGSGVIDGSIMEAETRNIAFTLLTNRHVVTQDITLVNPTTKDVKTISDVPANRCSAEMLNNSTIYYVSQKGGIFFNTSGPDFAVLQVENKDDKFKAVGIKQHCKKGSARIGDDIIVLGYPGIGSTQGITATEGIISGIENEYYVTSAKIDHGNSGGVAVHVKNNCYLGIPTFVEGGELESLGRILDINAFWSN